VSHPQPVAMGCAGISRLTLRLPSDTLPGGWDGAASCPGLLEEILHPSHLPDTPQNGPVFPSKKHPAPLKADCMYISISSIFPIQ